MAQNTHISWTDHTWNGWMGCSKVSPGCANCYAETLMDTRYGRVKWGPGNPRVRTSATNWRLPLRWNRQTAWDCPACGAVHFTRGLISGGYECFCSASGTMCHPRRPRVFCASLADWMDEEAPIGWLTDLLVLIYRTPNLDWLLLTKRPNHWMTRILAALENKWAHPLEEYGFAKWLRDWMKGTAPANVWIGTTVEDQRRAHERIPSLLAIPAKVRFLSCEPLLGPVFLPLEYEICHRAGLQEYPFNLPEKHRTKSLPGIHWVICGGESGANARPMNPDWVRFLRDQCSAAGVPFHFKQWGEWVIADVEHGLSGSVMPESGVMPCGKSAVWIGWDGKIQAGSAAGLTEPVMAIVRLGKKAAGRELDRREHNAFPEVC